MINERLTMATMSSSVHESDSVSELEAGDGERARFLEVRDCDCLIVGGL